MNPTTPRMQHLPAITHPWFSLFRFRSPLLTESLLFSLPVGTEMFHFPTFPPHTLYIQVRVTRHHSCWVSPFGHPRISARLTAPRGLSQPPTSFIGSWCQGIHRTLFITYNKDARVHCAVLKQHTTNHLTQTPDHHEPTLLRYDLQCSACRYLPRKNTRVFSQDPTVHRYNSPPTGTSRPAVREKNACQRSTHERPQPHMMGTKRSLPDQSSTCVSGHVWRCAP